jgi:ABC-type glycerol-3-phosphate transport system substrate-binding protein/KaiC/GvpD/RAD55 family RecA-like ATPase
MDASNKELEPRRLNLAAASTQQPEPRDPLGLPGLDDKLGGGVLRGSSLLLLGPAGSGKTFFALQFLLEAMHRGERGLYLYIGNASPLLVRGLPFQDQLSAQERQFRFQAVSQPLDEDIREPLERFLGNLQGMLRTRVAIEVGKAAEQMTEKELAFVAQLQRRLQDAGATTLVTNRHVPASWDQLGRATLLAPSADGMLLLSYLNPGKDLARGLTVLSLLGVAHEAQVHELELDADGLRLKASAPSVHAGKAGAMLLASPNFRSADEKKDYLAVARRLLKRRFPSTDGPQVQGRQLLFYDILTELNAPSTDHGLMLVYDAIIPFLARQGLIQPLDKAFPDADRRFLPVSLRRGMVDGQLFAVPLHSSARLLFYRKDLLEKHGFKPPRTWAELVETAQQVVERERKPRLRGLALQFPSYSQFSHLLDHLWAQGQDLYQHPSHWDFNSGAVISAMKQLHHSVTDERMAGPAALQSGYWEPVTEFMEGRAVFLHHYTDVLKLAHERGPEMARMVGWMPLPGGQDGGHCLLGGPSYVIPTRTRHPKAAFDALSYVFEPDVLGQLDLVAGWPFPGLRELYRDAKVMARHPYYDQAEAILARGRFLEELPYIKGNYLNWENAASQVLDPLFKRPADATRYAEAAEALKTRLSVFLPKPEYSDLVAKAVESIHRQLGHPLSVQTLAKELGVSRSHLIRQFKRGTRMTPLRYLNQARVDKAKELLQYTTFNVSEVSQQVGFKSIFHFSKVFRQISGRNPSEFKQFRYQPK